ncbi:V-set and immunoglobulin domain-containing protein 1-like isoform X1 [Python bivittatus]|uniref:V-set and immunoglobulin domain-containing protein 1-like isoform X1 n=1 Tax=Python bivittatus TaxID=176946 RepID=UPI000D6A0A20|nr:V-set and immunoglobulin domain-containing protein 1-like isoform X1 [Python bivittatus]
MKTLATMLRILATLTAVLGLAKGVVVTIPETSVNTTVGANITLPCTYKTASAPSMIQWNFYSAKYQQPSGPSPCLYRGEKSTSHCGKTVSVTDTRGRCSWIHKIYIWQLGKIYYSGQFKGRIQVATNMGNASLSIFNIQPSDTGVYGCMVFNPNDSISESEKSVTVSVLGTYFLFFFSMSLCSSSAISN